MRDLIIKALVRWCEDQRELYERQLALMEAKAMWTREVRNGMTVDTTAESIERVKELMAELDDLLDEYGKHPH
ncbi:MAG: hypothetical protein ACXVA4_10575 [Ktedonobacterales bacterium]